MIPLYWAADSQILGLTLEQLFSDFRLPSQKEGVISQKHMYVTNDVLPMEL